MSTPRPRESVAWVRRTVSPPLAMLAALLTAVLLRRDEPPVGRLGPAVTCALIMAGFASFRVVVNSAGLTVGFGPWGWPARNFRLGHIRRAYTEQRTALRLRYLGFGYKVSLGGSRVITGFTDALVVELDNGRTFGVTVPDAARAARLLNDLVGRPTTEGSGQPDPAH